MRRSFLNSLIAVAILSIMISGNANAADPGITQGEFVARLVAAFNWGGGRTELKEPDYLTILGGKRSFKFEAEETYDAKGDNVSVRTYELYGPFTGKGWVSGISVRTTAHLKIFVPLEGEYTLTVSAKGDGQVWEIGGNSFTVNSGGSFREVNAGKVFLKAGSHEVTVHIPPEGGVDYILINAPPFLPIEPLAGWKFSAPLRLHELAEIEAALFGLEGTLPMDAATRMRRIAAVDLQAIPPSLVKTSIGYLGESFGKQWLRAGINGAELDMPLEIATPGFYVLRLRLMGSEATLNFEDTNMTIVGRPYLEWFEIGGYRLSKGVHTLHLKLPPSGGIDVVEVAGKAVAPANYMAVTGIKGDPQATVSKTKLDGILSELLTRFTGRK